MRERTGRGLERSGDTTAGAVTLQRHAADRLDDELRTLLGQLSFATRVVARETRRAALVGRLGTAGSRNPSGDSQTELDLHANQVFLDAFAASGAVAGIVSEELEELRTVTCEGVAPYLLCIDPIDGSSNVDAGSSLGSIFGFYRRRGDGGSPCDDPEGELLGDIPLTLAGYVLYGPATVLVYSDGEGVDGFTLDPSVGEFLLSHPDIRCPERGSYYAVNSGNAPLWEPEVRTFVEGLAREDERGGTLSLRYTGGMVPDLHRMLLEGGIYLYPGDRDHPDGKIRLFYEAATPGVRDRDRGRSGEHGARPNPGGGEARDSSGGPGGPGKPARGGGVRAIDRAGRDLPGGMTFAPGYGPGGEASTDWTSTDRKPSHDPLRCNLYRASRRARRGECP